MSRRYLALVFYAVLAMSGFAGLARLVWAAIPQGAPVTYGSGEIAPIVNLTVSARTLLQGLLAFPGDVSPAQITANTNNYSVAAAALILRLTTSASWDLTGITGGEDGRWLIPCNVGSFNLVLRSESSSSTAANRFALTGDTTLVPAACALLQYDSTSLRWRGIAAGGSGGGASTLDQAFDGGNVIDSAVSGTREVRIGTAGSYVSIADDATFGPTLGATASGTTVDIVIDIQTGRNLITKLAGTTCETLTAAGLHTLATACKWRKSIYLGPDAFYMQGCTLTTTSAIVSGGLVEPYITCGDNDAHGFHRSIEMPDSWDGGVFTVLLDVVNVNATPANNYEVDFSAACLGNAVAYATTISITGEQPAQIDFDAGQSCGGSACAQNQRVRVTSAAITPNGTCTGSGRLLRLQGQVDASATTTSQVADVKIIGLLVEYTVNSRSD